MKKHNEPQIVEKTTDAKWNSILAAHAASQVVSLQAIEKGIYHTLRIHPGICIEVTLFLDYPHEVVPFNGIVASKRRYRTMPNIDYKTGLYSYTRLVEFTFSF